MHIERSFRVSSLLLVASSWTGLTLAAEVPWPLVILASIAVAICLLNAAGRGFDRLASQVSRISTEVWNVLLVVAFVACAADALWGSEDVLLAGVNFLVVLMVNKVFNLSQRKDFLHLYAISLLMLLATAALTVEPWYAFVFIAYLLAAIWTLLLYHLRNEAEEVVKLQGTAASFTPVTISAPFFWTTNGIALAALCLTLAIFFITPRAGTGFFQKGRGEPIRMAGFSQTVDLGVIGSVKLDPTVVMRVEFPDQEGPTLYRIYLQGAAYDLYTGRTWVNSLARRQSARRVGPGMFLISGRSILASEESAIRQEILIEALDAPVLFGVPEPRRINGNFLALHIDGIGGIHLPYPPSRRFQYRVLSVPTHLRPEDKKATAFRYPPAISKHFLQLSRFSPRMAALARDITKDAETPYRKAVAIKRHLLQNYTYSLDAGDHVPANPVEEFLFVRKSGYCEHYATAMVLMLRSQGIPARLVTGFLAGEWNDFGNYYTVRQQDAHAWVEVFFPRSGWVIFDPTPSLLSSTSNSPQAIFSRLIDSFRHKWTRFIVQYSARDQQVVLEEIRERSQPVRSNAAEWITVALKWMKNWRAWFAKHLFGWDWPHILAWITVSALALMLVRLWTRRGRWTFRHAAPHYTVEQLAATKLYARMLDMLESQGLAKPYHSAPVEFAGMVSGRWADAADIVNPLTKLYCRARFGAAPLTTDDVRSANSLLLRLRTLISQRQALAGDADSPFTRRQVAALLSARWKDLKKR